MFFYKRPLFYLDFNRFRFKKIKKFKKQCCISFFKKVNHSSLRRNVIFYKKNASNISLNKKFLKKSLYNNKFFGSKFFNKTIKRSLRLHSKRFKRKGVYSLNKFFIKYIKVERLFFLKMFNLKHTKQRSTTRSILSIHKYNPKQFKDFIELSILNILIRSKLCLSKNQALILISLNAVYKNYTIVKRPHTLITKKDILQLIFLRSFFFFYKYNYNLIYKRISKLNYCV